jgi:hypothetical protein
MLNLSKSSSNNKRRLNSMNAKIDQAIVSVVQREVKVGYINQLTADPVEFYHASTRISQQGVKPQKHAADRMVDLSSRSVKWMQ